MNPEKKMDIIKVFSFIEQSSKDNLLSVKSFCIVALLMILIFTGCSGSIYRSFNDPEIKQHLQQSDYIKIEYEHQIEKTACGAACLVSVMKYWEIGINQDEILKRRPPAEKEKGYSIGELKSIAKDNGLSAYSFKSDIEGLKGQILKGRPVIIPLKERIRNNTFESIPIMGWVFRKTSENILPTSDHFVVICGICEDGFWQMNPGSGIKIISIEEIKDSWLTKAPVILLAAK